MNWTERREQDRAKARTTQVRREGAALRRLRGGVTVHELHDRLILSCVLAVGTPLDVTRRTLANLAEQGRAHERDGAWHPGSAPASVADIQDRPGTEARAEGQGSTPDLGPGALVLGAPSEQQPEDLPARSSAAPEVTTGAGVETPGLPSRDIGAGGPRDAGACDAGTPATTESRVRVPDGPPLPPAAPEAVVPAPTVEDLEALVLEAPGLTLSAYAKRLGTYSSLVGALAAKSTAIRRQKRGESRGDPVLLYPNTSSPSPASSLGVVEPASGGGLSTDEADLLRDEADERIRVVTRQRDAAHEDLARARAELDAVRATFTASGPPGPLLAMAQGAALERRHLHERAATLKLELDAAAERARLLEAGKSEPAPGWALRSLAEVDELLGIDLGAETGLPEAQRIRLRYLETALGHRSRCSSWFAQIDHALGSDSDRTQAEGVAGDAVQQWRLDAIRERDAAQAEVASLRGQHASWRRHHDAVATFLGAEPGRDDEVLRIAAALHSQAQGETGDDAAEVLASVIAARADALGELAELRVMVGEKLGCGCDFGVDSMAQLVPAVQRIREPLEAALGGSDLVRALTLPGLADEAERVIEALRGRNLSGPAASAPVVDPSNRRITAALRVALRRLRGEHQRDDVIVAANIIAALLDIDLDTPEPS